MFTSISRFLMVIVFALSLVALLGSISTVNATAQRHDPVIEVVVTDINHQPIAGAFVAIYDITSMQGGLARLVATGTSDAAGKIALTLAGERSLAMQRLYSNIADQTLYSISDYQITVATVAQGAIARDVHTLSYTFADHERLALVNPNLSGAEVQSLVEEAEAGANEFKVDMTPVEPQMTPFAVYTQPDRSMSPTSPQQQAIECRLPVSLEQTPWGEGKVKFAQVNIPGDNTVGVTFKLQTGATLRLSKGLSIPGYSGSATVNTTVVDTNLEPLAGPVQGCPYREMAESQDTERSIDSGKHNCSIKYEKSNAMEWVEESHDPYIPAVWLKFEKRHIAQYCRMVGLGGLWQGKFWDEIVTHGFANYTPDDADITGDPSPYITASEATGMVSNYDIGESFDEYLSAGFEREDALGVSFEVPVGGGAVQNEILLKSTVITAESTFHYHYSFHNNANLQIDHFILADQDTNEQMWWTTYELRPDLEQRSCWLSYAGFDHYTDELWSDKHWFDLDETYFSMREDHFGGDDIWLKQNHPWCEANPALCAPECQAYPELCQGAQVRSKPIATFKTSMARRNLPGSIYPNNLKVRAGLQFLGTDIGLLPAVGRAWVYNPVGGPNSINIPGDVTNALYKVKWDSGLRSAQNRFSNNFTIEQLTVYQGGSRGQTTGVLDGHITSWDGWMYYAHPQPKHLSGQFSVDYEDHPDYCLGD